MDTAQAIQQAQDLETTASEEPQEMGFKERLRYVLKETTGSWLGAIPIVGGLAEAVFTTSVKLADKRRDVYMQNQEDFFALVMSRLRELAKESPVVVFLDDLQWADASSLGLLLYLAKNLQDKPYPLLLIGSYRPEDIRRGRINSYTGELELHPLEEKLSILMRYDACQEIQLSRFSAEQVEHYITSRFARNEFGSEFVQEIAHVTNGNSLFVQEMLTNMVERKIVLEREGVWRTTRKLDYSRLPRTVEGVIKERYERLSGELQELLQVAAVEGEDFSLEVIEVILEEQPLKLHRKLDALMRKYHVVQKSSKVYERLSKIYEFTHNLVQKYIYYSMNDDFRGDLHRLIADTLKKMLGEEGIRAMASQYSFHLGVGYGIIDENRRVIAARSSAMKVDAGVLGQYTALLKEMAERHIKAYNNQEAINACGEVIELARSMDDAATEIDYTLKKGAVLKLIGRWKDAESDYNAALAKGEAIGDASGMANARMELGWHLLLQGDYNVAMQHFQCAMDLFEQLGDKGGMSRCASNIGAVYRNQGNYRSAMECYKRSVMLAEELGNRQRAAITTANMGNVYADQEDYENALNCFQKYLALCDELGDKRGTATALGLMGAVYADQKDHTSAMIYYKKYLTISEQLGDKHSIARVVGNMGIIYEELGDYVNAMESYRKRLTIAEELGDRSGAAIAFGNMGNVYKDQGDYSTAMSLYDKALNEHRAIGYSLGVIMWLYGKSETTLRALRSVNGEIISQDRQARLLEARTWAQECVTLAEQIHRQDRCFKGKVLLAKIEFAMGNREIALQHLHEMLDDSDGADQAELKFELGVMKREMGESNEADAFMQQALAMYEKLYRTTARSEYHKRMKELQVVMSPQ